MADDKIDRVIIEFFTALKELGELRHRYDNAVVVVMHARCMWCVFECVRACVCVYVCV